MYEFDGENYLVPAEDLATLMYIVEELYNLTPWRIMLKEVPTVNEVWERAAACVSL